MIQLFASKQDCCACGACMNVCPKSAIQMELDEYGFVYPRINKEQCIECGACKKVCAFQNKPDRNEPKKVYATVGKNDNIVEKSASGGLFATMADFVIERGGCVYGAAMQLEEGTFRVRHIRCETKDELYLLQGSKYVQSALGDILKDVKEKLKNDVFVLFSGTPCQIDALKLFLKKDYSNLLTVDIICHGVPNERFFNSYICQLQKKLGGKIYEFNFRDKSSGWGHFGKARYTNENGNECEQLVSFVDSSYYSLFFDGKILRENCYRCHYAGPNRPGDITLGDYWGINDQHPEALTQNGGHLNPQKGISVVFVNSTKGNEFLDKIKDQIYCYESTFEKAAKQNTQLVHPVKLDKSRAAVMNIYKAGGYNAVEICYLIGVLGKKAKNVIRKIVPKSVKVKIKRFLHK